MALQLVRSGGFVKSSACALLVLALPLWVLMWQVRRKLGSPGILHPGAPGHARQALQDGEVPQHDQRARRRWRAVARRRAPDAVWPLFALHQPGRAARAVERAQGRHEPGRAAPAAGGIPAALQPRAGPPPRSAPRHHRLGPSQWPQRHRLGSQIRWTCGTWTTAVAVAGHQDFVAHHQKVLVRDGISAAGEATMGKFTGSKS
jgi:hypothetical protein